MPPRDPRFPSFAIDSDEERCSRDRSRDELFRLDAGSVHQQLPN